MQCLVTGYRGNKTHLVSSSWWWALKCPKHVARIISAIMHTFVSQFTFSDNKAKIHNQPDANMSKIFLKRTTQLRTGLTACCTLYSQRHSTTRKSNALRIFWGQLTEWEENIFFAPTAWNVQFTDHTGPTTHQHSAPEYYLFAPTTRSDLQYWSIPLLTHLLLLLIKYNLILGHMQHIASPPILYVTSIRLPHEALLLFEVLMQICLVWRCCTFPHLKTQLHICLHYSYHMIQCTWRKI